MGLRSGGRELGKVRGDGKRGEGNKVRERKWRTGGERVEEKGGLSEGRRRDGERVRSGGRAEWRSGEPARG